MRALILLLSFFAAACARPDYIDPISRNGSQSQATDCPLKFTQSSLCASLDWVQGPQSPNESEFILKFWNKSSGTKAGPFVDPPQTLSVILWMPSMGHGSSPVTIEKIEDGTYRVRRVYFIMPGDWEIRTFLKDGATVIDQATVSLVL
ncbi:MAG: FixH family protein [Bdellovibrio sp.]|nr:FixH family protein [Bdellovibrio sp.]